MSDTVGAALAEAAAQLTEAGIEDGRREARLLLAHALRLDAAAIFSRPERALSSEEIETICAIVVRRTAREPLSRITGQREFWSLNFRLTPDTLDPRPDSETLVQAVLDAIPDRTAPLRLLDLGTGSGCLLLALLSELPQAWGLGGDLNPGAARAAAANARALGLGARSAFMSGDWGQALQGRFDAILVNPPYIPEGEIAGLEPEVARWDPMLALAGGKDGLDAVRVLAANLPQLVEKNGVIGVELGAGQHDDAAALFKAAGLETVAKPKDLGGVIRCLLMRPAKPT
ncbi:MAG TPA: peptide chain release factor N(5)-glutamine methyltransferase [Magnetospirillaceae bacterium]|jgi:release factor glutamine methyltransferase